MKNNHNKKTIFNRFLIGLKVGWNAPVLPAKVLSLHNNLFIRIFIIIVGISILTVFVLSLFFSIRKHCYFYLLSLEFYFLLYYILSISLLLV